MPRPLHTRFAMLATVLVLTNAHAAQDADAADDGGRVVAVSLSSGGMAQVRRVFSVDGNQTLHVQAPLRDVDDWLKSLVVRDPAGTVAGMSLDGPAPLEETFRTLPFDAQDMAALPDLAQALAGTRVRASSGGRNVEGVILGVERPAQGPTPAGEAAEPAARLSVLTAPGRIDLLRLGPDATLEILDDAMRERLTRAATVTGLGTAQHARNLAIALEGTGAREVVLDHLVAAPVWKTSHRLVLQDDGKARLQSWAVVENATGEDWRDVELTLTTGAPVMYRQALYEHTWHERPVLGIETGAAEPPRRDDSAERPMAEASAASGQLMLNRAARVAAAPAPAPPPPMAAGSAGAAPAEEGATAASYRLPRPVTLAAGGTLAIPFVDAEVAGSRIAVFQADRGQRHPVAGVMLQNDTGVTLPPGILTVYDPDGAHAGDAALAAVPPSESRLALFAEDRKVEVTAETRPQEDITDVRIADGVLQATRVQRLNTQYRVKGAPDAARELLIEVPRRPGWQARSDALSGETATHWRLRQHLDAGAQAEIALVQERQQAQTLALLDADADVLMRWSGAAADDATRERLRELADLRRELAGAEQAVQRADGDLERAQANQARVRDNLAAVPADSTLGQRYVKMLADEEDRIAGLAEARDAAAAKATAMREMLGSALAKPAS
ncbi:DUF4139 domain-containing protein [Verticiella sediminum]|uniref:DUF4139 domain-containing protein n=1 Tax=Verticiella sediminum TaxID=1247510 RepID=A0A556AWS6_9BURK|nr:DUF4139 domain-containing protein [Verticiella sediminum]TSH97401.1 DUF4139 domain-containing protein [Verticiella sediminum]